MGLNFLFSSSCGNRDYYNNGVENLVPKVNLPNPNPHNYTIIRDLERVIYVKNEVVDRFLLIEVEYHDCNNYEGRKIMIFNCGLQDLLDQGWIDPHFTDNDSCISPIVRIIPTDNGWDFGVNLITGDYILQL
jgi:hypothetical protein